MNDKIEEYRRRRAKRLQKRLDAKDDNDEGRWVTTENDNRVHLNKNGVPDKGNPFVLAAMTGKKPKLSMNYHQKNVAKAAKSGNATDVLDELLKIPNGSKVLINGEKYKANFGGDESGRWIDFVNTEDEDDVLSTFEVAMAIQENGDVSLEAPDRKEKESEPTYEPDVEPENEEYFPDDDIEMPDIPEDYGEVSPQEEPDNVPEEVAPQENPDDLPTGIAPQDAGALGPSAMAGELKSIIKNQVSDDISDADFVAGYEEAISQLEEMADGTQIKVGDKTYTKTNDPDYPFVLETTGQTVSADTVYNSLETAATMDDDFEMEVVEPEGKETGESNPVSENKKQAYELLKSIMGLKYGDLENGEWDSAYDKAKEIIEGIPEDTEISVGGHKFQKYDDSIFPLVDAETGELHSVGDLTNFLNEENNEGVVIGSQEEAPQEQAVVQNDPVSAREKILDLMADAEAGNFVPDNVWTQAFNNLPEGTTLTNKFGSELTLEKDENGKAKFVNQNGVQLKNHKIIEFLRDKSYGYKVNVPEETAPQEQGSSVPEESYESEDFAKNMTSVLQQMEDEYVEGLEDKLKESHSKFKNFVDKIPTGTEVEIGNLKITKIDNDLYPFMNSETGELVTTTDISGATNDLDYGETIKIGSASKTSDNDLEIAKNQLNELIDSAKSGNWIKSKQWEEVFSKIPDGTKFVNKNGNVLTKQTNASGYPTFYKTFQSGNTMDLGMGILTETLNEGNPYNYVMEQPEAESNTQTTSSGSANASQDFSNDIKKAKHKKEMLTSEEWDKYSDQVIDPINDKLQNAPTGSQITVKNSYGDLHYTKSDNGVWETDDGITAGSYGIAYALVNHDNFSLQEINFANGPKSESVSPASSGAMSYSNIKANGSGKIQEIKSDIDSFVSNVKSGGYTSKVGLGKKLSSLEDGSSIKLGNKTYIKGTDGDGDVSFQNSTNEYDTLTASGLAAKIANKAKDFDNPIIEVNDKEHSPKKKPSTIAPVYIPESIPEPKKADSISFSNDDFSQERKDNALWDTGNGQSYDNVMRGISGKVWQGLNQNAKNALWEYTTSTQDGNFSNVNNYLRKPDHDHQSEAMQHKMRNRIGYITKAISQSQAPQDMWVQRGIPLKNLRRLFGVSEAEFDEARKNGGADAVLDLFKSSVPYGQDEGFMSCGSTKGHGFSGSDVILNVYCPKGTQMLYSEPFSAFGHGAKKSWDGTSKQNWFSSEDETILQRGTKLVPTKVSYSNGTWYVDVDVIGQEYSDKI